MMYDLIVLGGGPAGYNAAERAGHAGLKTLVIEERALGGVCLNEGCIPTKTLLYSAKIYDYAKHGKDYGVTFGSAAIDHAFVVNRKNGVVKQLVSGVGAKLKKCGVEVVKATAMIKERNAEGFVVTAEGKDYVGKQLLIATGSSPALPPIDGLADSLKEGFALTNREILDITEIPKTIVVVGGGVIGLEMASYFNSVGAKVYVVEMMDHIAGAVDRDISKLLQKDYASRGVEFILGAKVTSIKNKTVSYEKDGKITEIPADYALVSIGRRARTAGIGCENIGLKLERGAIVTDELGKTNVPGVWAAGDVNGKSMLAHTAYREGEVCINNILGKKDRVNYNSIPAVIYTNPEVASVGETEESAKAKGLDVDVKSVTLKYSGRYIAENEHGYGILKVLTDKKHKNIVGLHMIGSYASEIIYGAAMMVETEMRVEDIQKLVFPHPTVCEVIRESMFM
ncbi:MAG: dihydrolipoyl dehydrogenase [Ruminococcaceae bacterium]|nr:dihydrolipoyl dehydrogenase [Oscillospiraceae bacterium]